jgi:hypothetical protein
MYSSLLRSGRSWDRIPVGDEIFRTSQEGYWGPPNPVYDGYYASFLGVKWPGRGVNHPTPSSAEVKERVDLYFYSPSASLWPVL